MINCHFSLTHGGYSRMKISVIMSISVLRFYRYIGYIDIYFDMVGLN